jgi:hypothetical protein
MGPIIRPNTKEMIRFLHLIAVRGQVIELRLLKVNRGTGGFACTISGYFDDHEKLANEAVRHSPVAQGAYITLNPVNPDLLARSANRLRVAGKDSPLTTDADILVRRWMPIDFDPVRPAGISSTDEEHELALTRAYAVRDALRLEGFPDPIVADSGNGGHLLYEIDLPGRDQDLIKHCLQALASRFDDGRVTVDPAVFNPSRIWKLYGTFSRKGDSLPQRPHRMARILEVPCDASAH